MAKRSTKQDPETQVGICCGCNVWNLLLFKVPGIYRYRCAPCYRKETGTDHPQCVRIFRAIRVTRADAGGALYAPVDQFGIESGDTPSYDGSAIANRSDHLNMLKLAPVLPNGAPPLLVKPVPHFLHEPHECDLCRLHAEGQLTIYAEHTPLRPAHRES